MEKDYKVTITIEMDILAEDEKEAKSIAREMLDDQDYGCVKYEITEK